MTEDTQKLLSALNALDYAIVEIVVKLLDDTLSPGEHHRFGDMFTDVGQLLRERGRAISPGGNDPGRTAAKQPDNPGDGGG